MEQEKQITQDNQEDEEIEDEGTEQKKEGDCTDKNGETRKQKEGLVFKSFSSILNVYEEKAINDIITFQFHEKCDWVAVEKVLTNCTPIKLILSTFCRFTVQTLHSYMMEKIF